MLINAENIAKIANDLYKAAKDNLKLIDKGKKGYKEVATQQKIVIAAIKELSHK